MTPTTTKSKWAARVREWKASGLTGEEYAEGKGYAGATLRWWCSRLRRDQGGGQVVPQTTAPTSHVRMARVVRAHAMRDTGLLTVRVGTAAVEVRAGFDGGLLRAVVEALGGQS
jgi:hypothetical protein